MTRGFLTIAYGPAYYLRMAKGLARSMRFHNPNVHLTLVTDSADPGIRGLFDATVPLDASLGAGVSQKLHVDRYSPYDQTLFVDSDCLAFADPERLWEMYREAKGFGVKGWTYIKAGDPHYAVDDVGRLLAKCGVEHFGAFNSGLFYFDRSPEAQLVFQTARKLAQDPQELGLRAFKNSPCADEPIFGLALELSGIPMLPWDDGEAMCTATAEDLEGLESIDVFAGQRRLVRYQTVTEPVILHFHLGAQESFPYFRELCRLRLGPRYGRGLWPAAGALPAWMRSRLRYLTRRATQRMSRHGLRGLVPERMELAWKRRFRNSLPPAP
jgi:hypothetical protein